MQNTHRESLAPLRTLTHPAPPLKWPLGLLGWIWPLGRCHGGGRRQRGGVGRNHPLASLSRGERGVERGDQGVDGSDINPARRGNTADGSGNTTAAMAWWGRHPRGLRWERTHCWRLLGDKQVYFLVFFNIFFIIFLYFLFFLLGDGQIYFLIQEKNIGCKCAGGIVRRAHRAIHRPDQGT